MTLTHIALYTTRHLARNRIESRRFIVRRISTSHVSSRIRKHGPVYLAEPARIFTLSAFHSNLHMCIRSWWIPSTVRGYWRSRADYGNISAVLLDSTDSFLIDSTDFIDSAIELIETISETVLRISSDNQPIFRLPNTVCNCLCDTYRSESVWNPMNILHSEWSKQKRFSPFYKLSTRVYCSKSENDKVRRR